MRNFEKKMDILFESPLGKRLGIPLLVIIMVFLNFVIFSLVVGLPAERYFQNIYIYSVPFFVLGFLLTFFINFLILYKLKKYFYNQLPYKFALALINLLLVCVATIILFNQLSNVTKIKLYDSNDKEYNLLVAAIPYEKIIANPLQGQKNIVLEESVKLNVLQNLDDNSKGATTLPDNIESYRKMTPISNLFILTEVMILFSLTPIRLLLPIFVNKKKE